MISSLLAFLAPRYLMVLSYLPRREVILTLSAEYRLEGRNVQDYDRSVTAILFFLFLLCTCWLTVRTKFRKGSHRDC